MKFAALVALVTPASGFFLSSKHQTTRLKILPVEAKIVNTDSELTSLAGYFVDNFWVPQVAEITADQRAGLVTTQVQDFINRYGDIMGKRRLTSALLVDEDMAGVCGVELTLVARNTQTVVSRDQGEMMIKSAISRFTPKERKLLKFFEIKDLVADVLDGEFDVVPVLSNLAVGTGMRRGGVGMKLCQAVEKICSEWDFEEIWLQVEEQNTPARRLYENKLGYAQEWKVNGGSVLRVDTDDPEGSFSESVAPLLVLSKRLGGGAKRTPNARSSAAPVSTPSQDVDEWLAALDEATGNTYYYSTVSGETSWDPPS
mmetsp:Transcript_22617/g.46368  ORF Transcript_22617/g.46368 Transcript_22617/m.46368 type:complete len:314 (-) Transcript_22617:86-1027(-)